MFGEGFDLPQLKIAALHDVKQSLAITLQLVGRYTRPGDNLGEPTFIANTFEDSVVAELESLYTEDANWNLLLPQASDDAIQEQISLREFYEGFPKPSADLPLDAVSPALSTVIYRTQCAEWTPQAYVDELRSKDNLTYFYHDINPVDKTLVVMIAQGKRLEWTALEEVRNLEWDLQVIFWDKEHELLFINTSSVNDPPNFPVS